MPNAPQILKKEASNLHDSWGSQKDGKGIVLISHHGEPDHLSGEGALTLAFFLTPPMSKKRI